MGARDIYDVAERAQVSIATVSRVLNAPHKVSPATRERVLAAIDELKFVPKAEAVARSRKATGRIAVVAPFFTFPSFTERLRGVATALTTAPYELTIYVVDTAARRDAYLTSLAVTGRVDGLILLALPFGEEVAGRLLFYKVDAVLVEFVRAPFSSVEIDDVAGGRLAGQYLLDRGHRRCAFIGDLDVPDYAIRTSDRRLEDIARRSAKPGWIYPMPMSRWRRMGWSPLANLRINSLICRSRRPPFSPPATRRRWAH